MIGKNLKSIRHLFRLSDDSLTPIIFKMREGNETFGLSLKVKYNNRDTLFIFNNDIHSSPIDPMHFLRTNNFGKYCNEVSKYSYLIQVDSENMNGFNQNFMEIVLLPKSFSEDFSSFLSSNSKMIKSANEKYGFGQDNDILKLIYIFSNGSKNFFLWAINLLYSSGVSFETIKSVLIWNDLYGQLVKNLSKKTITAYNSRASIDELVKELIHLRKNKRIVDAINTFNTAQKKLLKNNTLSDIDKETLAKFTKLSDVKRLNFIKKVSTIEDFNELMRQMRNVCAIHFDWNKDSLNEFLENVDNIKYKKIFESDKVVLVEVFDYETIKQLAKTTNWCISKNKSYWNRYVEVTNKKDCHQYIIFDFSKNEDDNLSIVGFTVNKNKGIVHAHDFVNNNLMDNNEERNMNLINSFISRFLASNNIYKVLNNDGIDINLIADYEKSPYEWNKDALLSYLYECVNQENTEILKSDDNKLVISVCDKNIMYFFGETYMNTIPKNLWKLQHILFIDFSLSAYDLNRIQYAIIQTDNITDEDYCGQTYNIYSLVANNRFESILIDFGLPYDTIRRTNNIYKQLYDGFSSFNSKMIKSIIAKLSTKELNDFFTSYMRQDNFYSLLNLSAVSYYSLDYVKILYENGISLSKIIGNRFFSSLIGELIRNVKDYGGALRIFYKTPSEEDVKNLYEKKINNRDYTCYVCSYEFIRYILKNENNIISNKNDYYYLISSILDKLHRYNGEIFDSLMIDIAKTIDFTTSNEGVKNWLFYATRKKSATLMKFIEDYHLSNVPAKAKSISY